MRDWLDPLRLFSPQARDIEALFKVESGFDALTLGKLRRLDARVPDRQEPERW